MKKRTALFVTAAIFLIALVAFIFMKFSDFGTGKGEIVLPQRTVIPENASDLTMRNVREVSSVEINPQNVQRIIASMKRPSQYSASFLTSYYFEDSKTVFVSTVSAKNGLFRVVLTDSQNMILKNIILTLDNVYIWENDGKAVYTGSRGDINIDDESRTPSYESLVLLPQQSITDAGTQDRNGVLCIYVKTSEEGRNTEWYIDVVSGLLLECTVTENGKTVCSSEMTELSVSDVDDALFILPSGAFAE